MKRLMICFLTITSLCSFADDDCKSIMKEFEDQEVAVLLVGGAVTAPFVAVAPPLGGVLAGTFAVNYAIASHKPRYVRKLIEQAEVCSGSKLERLYDKFMSRTESRISISEFCEKITQGNEDRSLCPSSKFIKNKKDLIEYLD